MPQMWSGHDPNIVFFGAVFNKAMLPFVRENAEMSMKRLKVSDIMSSDVWTVGGNDILSVAEDLMKKVREK